MNKGGADDDDRCDMSHSQYGLDMRAGLWRARCSCGWRSAPSPDVGAETAHLDEHLRSVVARDQRRVVDVIGAHPVALRRSARNVLVGAVGLGMAAAALSAWVDHDVDGL